MLGKAVTAINKGMGGVGGKAVRWGDVDVEREQYLCRLFLFLFFKGCTYGIWRFPG